MNTPTDTNTPFDKAFAKNLEIRTCSFDPTNCFELESDEYGTRRVLPLAYKQLWFHAFCQENGIVGQIEADDYSIQEFAAAQTGIVTARAKVIMNGKVVATAASGKSFLLNNTNIMDSVIQAATGSAQSRALSNAGFGTICTQKLDFTPTPVPSSDADHTPVPFTVPLSAATSAPGSAASDPPAPVLAQSPVANTANPIVETQQESFLQTDPMENARAVIWPFKGVNAGKTMGEVLATSPKNIIWMAEVCTTAGPAKDAALLLLDEAKRKTGH